LYIQLLEWGRAECRRSGIDPTNENLREMIWPMLQNIRFAVMNMEDIAKTVNNTNILTSKEILALLTYQGIKVKEDKEKEEKEKDKDKDKDYKEEKEEKDGKGQTTTTSRGGLPDAWFNTEKKRGRPVVIDFKFDGILKSRDVRILENGRIAQTPGGNIWQTVLCDHEFSEGVITWDITLDLYTNVNGWNVATGIVPISFSIAHQQQGSTFGCRGTQGWVLITGTGQKATPLLGQNPIPYTARFTQGDRIGHKLDLDKRTLEFFRNGKSLGIAFKDILGPVRVAVSCFDQQTVTLQVNKKL